MIGPPAQKDAPSDADLIERSRREPGCFAGLFDRHGKEILRYAYARLGPDEDFGDRSAERATAERLRPQLLAVLGELPVRDRELLLLVAWAGLTYEEAASALDLSVGAVRSRLHRVRVRTRSALGGVNPAGMQDWENDRG